MGVTFDTVKYGDLLARTLPRVIISKKEFNRVAAELEELDFAGRGLTAEEESLRELLAALVEDYDKRERQLPELEPRKMLAFLLEQRGLRQADLVPVAGSRSQVSDMLSGRRSISKAQAKKLAEFFQVGVQLFI